MVTERYLKLLQSFRRLNEEIDLCTLNSRVIFQKKVYFLQEFGCNLGYHFGWYLKGPYSSDLTDDAYKIKGLEPVLPDASFNISEDDIPTSTDRLTRFLVGIRSLITTNKTEDYWLELAGSLHFLKSKLGAENKNDAFDQLSRAKPNKFIPSDMEVTWRLLAENNLINVDN